LDEVYQGRFSSSELLMETIRCLLILKGEREQRMHSLLHELRSSSISEDLSAEAIVKLISQHLACKGSSRLPVLIISASYLSFVDQLGEQPIP
jgi:hypothetical protein